MKSLKIKPAPGGRIRMPERNYKVMPDEGAEVPRSMYYIRCLMRGDVVEIGDQTKPEMKSKTKGKAE